MDFHRLLCAYPNVYEHSFTGLSYLEVLQNCQAKRKLIFSEIFCYSCVTENGSRILIKSQLTFSKEERRNVVFLSMQHIWILQYKMSDVYIVLRICGKNL